MITRDLLEARLFLYRLLSALYRYPLDGAKLSALPYASYLGQLIGVPNNLHEMVAEVDDALIERLNVEMTRLLEGPGVTPAVPYASYYLHGGQLMGVSAQSVRRAYLEWGVEPEQDSIPPDHIALELGFISFLAEQALEDDRREDALRASLIFLRNHLQPWLTPFCDSLEVAAQEPFFRALATLTRQFISADLRQLTELFHNQSKEDTYENN